MPAGLGVERSPSASACAQWPPRELVLRLPAEANGAQEDFAGEAGFNQLALSRTVNKKSAQGSN